MATKNGVGQPATAESGFIFAMSPPENAFTSDTYFQRVLKWYLPADVFAGLEQELTAFAEETSSERIREWVLNAEKEQPYVRSHNVWGARYDVDRLVTSEGWKRLKQWGAEHGTVAAGYEPQHADYRRIVQHAKNYFFMPVSALTSCPLSMTDGAAHLLQEILPSLPATSPLHDVYKRLVSRTDSWTSGQWMTERPGGSDVQNTETWAVHQPLANKSSSNSRLDEGEYLVSGFKFFSSATDADVTVLLAKTESGKLSAFLTPLKKQLVDADGKEKTVTNGIRIHRLKNKLGTKQLPTAELELKDARAHLVGPLDGGVRTIAHILNVTRSWAFMGSVSAMRRSLSISKQFAKARTVFGYPLWLLPLHLRTLAGVELKVRSSLQLSLFTLALVSFTENSYPSSTAEASYAPLPKQGEEARVILRTLTATSKAVLSKTAVFAVQECMEAMGGVGYMDDPDEAENLARALRDISVNTIWEGTTNVLSSEVVRHLLNRNHLEIFNSWLQRAIPTVKDDLLRETLLKSWNILHNKLSKNKEYLFDALANGRAIMFSLAWILSGLLLAVDAQRDQDIVATESARRWILDKEGTFRDYLIDEFNRLPSTAREQEGKERAKWDCQMVWNMEMPDIAPFGHRTPSSKI